ncbi:MAG: glycosyl transferase, WecB/TagA/CpsF family [Verrucomicrobiales bacterium]|nr:glycosyl transferase, WecB/TagA/CpsF family [Verrucomicrobiales bacterium]
METINTRRVEFLGCPLDLMTTTELLEELKGVVASRGRARVIQFINANKIAQVHRDRGMGEIMRRADYVLADGMPLLPMGKMLGVRIPERIDGIGLMTRLLGWAEENGFSVFFLGAKDEVLQACVAKLRERHPKLKVAGMRDGYFKTPEAAGVAAQIREARADLVFLGMGSPMKEKFADEQVEAMGVSVIQGVGGSFDVMAGVVKRAPVWLQKLGLEWLFRIVQEPRRMFWRYAVTNFSCLRLFARALLCRLTGMGRVPSTSPGPVQVRVPD